MQIGLLILLLIPVVLMGFVLLSAIPLYFTTKLFGLRESSFLKAVGVTFGASLLSLLVSGGLVMVGMVIPFLPHLLSILAPFLVYLWVVMMAYQLSFLQSLLVAVVEYLVGVILALAVIFTVVIPLGLGAAILSQ